MIFFVYMLACVALVVMKSIVVQKDLNQGTYSYKSALALLLFWLALVIPGVNSPCTDITCAWDASFSWWGSLVGIVQSSSGLNSNTIPAAALLAAGTLTVYVLGHCFGWILHFGQRFFQAEA